MNNIEDRILAEAADWHAASGTDEMDWAGFTAWLEADPRHRHAYDEIALVDALVEDHRDALRTQIGPIAANDEDIAVRPERSRWWRWAGAAVAASLVGLLVLPDYLGASPEIYETSATARGIVLDDGSSVKLAPHSRLVIEGRQQERIALSGGAWFDIVHDPDRPLVITAGDVRISDIGTQFDVQSERGNVRVEVAQGKVEVAAAALAQPIRLAAGKGLLLQGGAGPAVISAVKAGDAGEWRSGRLSYDSTPLPLVAADLARYAGVSVKVPDSLGNRRFSGTLIIGDGEAAVRDLSQVMELALVPDAGGYRLAERNR